MTRWSPCPHGRVRASESLRKAGAQVTRAVNADHPHRWAIVALVSAALFGASTPVAKTMLATISPQLLAGILYIGPDPRLTAFRVIAGE